MIYQAVLTRVDNNAILNTRLTLPYCGNCRIKFLHVNGLSTNFSVPTGFIGLLTSPQIIDERPILIGSPITNISGGVPLANIGWFVAKLGDEYEYDNVFINGFLVLQFGWFSGNVFIPNGTGGSVGVLLTMDIQYMDEKKN